jgi:hypothetical protein
MTFGTPTNPQTGEETIFYKETRNTLLMFRREARINFLSRVRQHVHTLYENQEWRTTSGKKNRSN